MPRPAQFPPLHGLLMLVALVCGLFAVAQVLGGLGFRFDPFDTAGRKLKQARGQASVAASDAGARRIEVAGASDTLRRTEAAAAVRPAALEIIHRYDMTARIAPDADTPIEPDRLARRLAADRELCGLRPSVCAGADPAAAPRAAGGSDQALHSGPDPTVADLR